MTSFANDQLVLNGEMRAVTQRAKGCCGAQRRTTVSSELKYVKKLKSSSKLESSSKLFSSSKSALFSHRKVCSLLNLILPSVYICQISEITTRFFEIFLKYSRFCMVTQIITGLFGEDYLCLGRLIPFPYDFLSFLRKVLQSLYKKELTIQ